MLEMMKAEFEKWHRFPVTDDMDIHTEIAWKNWQSAWNAGVNAERDCRLCAHYTTDSGGCNSTVQCVGGSGFKKTGPRQYWVSKNKCLPRFETSILTGDATGQAPNR